MPDKSFDDIIFECVPLFVSRCENVCILYYADDISTGSGTCICIHSALHTEPKCKYTYSTLYRKLLRKKCQYLLVLHEMNDKSRMHEKKHPSETIPIGMKLKENEREKQNDACQNEQYNKSDEDCRRCGEKPVEKPLFCIEFNSSYVYSIPYTCSTHTTAANRLIALLWFGKILR